MTKHCNSIIFSCIYIPPSANNSQTLDKLRKISDSLMIEPQAKHAVFNDFNINELNENKRKNELIVVLDI